MKMSYLLKSKPKHEYRAKILSVIILFISLYILQFLFPSFTKNIIYSVSRPVWAVENKIPNPFSKFVGFFKSQNNLINQNLSLEDELSSLKLKEIDYDLLYKENQDLKNELGRGKSNNRILSRVISGPPNSPYDTFIIDIGGSNVSVGDKVYISDNVIVGVIQNVTFKNSLVELFSTGGKKTQSILSRTGASYILIGRGGSNFELVVPKDTDVIWGDVFVYPGLSSSVIGIVSYVDTTSQSSFKTVYIKIPGNIFSSKNFFVENQ